MVNIRTAQSRVRQIEALCAKTDEECLPRGIPCKNIVQQVSRDIYYVWKSFYTFSKKTHYFFCSCILMFRQK